MRFSKKVAKEKRERKNTHEKNVRTYETTGEPHGITDEQYQNSKNELEKMHNELTEGYILRSKCKWYEDGEKSIKLCLDFERKKAIQGTIQVLVNEDGSVTTNDKDI